MNIIKEKRIINLNSEDATNFYNGTFLSDVNFNFRGLLQDNEDILYCEGGILNAQIPVSFYQVAYYNNTLFYQIATTIYSITIPVGNYNFSTFATALESAFLLNGHTFAVIINETTGVLQFSLIIGGSGFTFLGASSGTTIFKILGFNPAQNYPDDGANNLIAPFLLNLLGAKKLKISSQTFSNSSHDTTNYATSNLIATLSVDAPSYGLIIFNNLIDSYGRLKVKQIDNIDIQIKDEYGNFINFNNTDWSITLAINIYRKFEQKNTDLLKVLDTLTILEQEIAQQQVPDTGFEGESTNLGTNEAPAEEASAEDTGILEPNMNDLTDLDLLLYRNPNMF
jgi:hypothetical protein